MATPSFPRERFDDLPDHVDRVGVHRRPRRSGRGWVAFAWAALATGVIVGAGVIALGVITRTGGVDLPLPTASSPASSSAAAVEPRLDPDIVITVLNGTTTAGLAATTGDLLAEEGWAGAAIGVGTRANTAEPGVTETVAYYSDAADEAAAAALIESLGVGTAVLSDLYPESPLTVVLGEDYAALQGSP